MTKMLPGRWIVFGLAAIALVTGCPPAPPAQTTAHDGVSEHSLYQQLGGRAAIETIAGAWIDRARTTKGLDRDAQGRPIWPEDPARLATLKQRFAEFLCVLTGGPEVYAGKTLYASHQSLGITPLQFDDFLVAGDNVLVEQGTPGSANRELMDMLEHLSSQIVASSRPAR